MTHFIGIDPGLSGALAVLGDSGAIYLHKCPTARLGRKRVMDHRAAFDLLADAPGDAFACIEKVGARPGQGVVSMFSFGQNLGAWEMALAAAGVAFERVTPQSWKAKMGIPKGSDKAASIRRAEELFPAIDLVPAGGRVKSDALAEALLLAEYARRLRTQINS